MKAMCAVATLDTKSHQTTEHVWVRHIISDTTVFTICTILYFMQLYASTCCHTDIDECALGTNGCNQYCINTIGSYLCTCYIGYQISLNHRICVGKTIYHLCHSNCSIYIIQHIIHCATAFSMQSCAESAYQPYADEYR